ncbi:primosomal replication protein PriC [Vibrio salinus]|uniref:primosomal replication protein PriC n=1 Tax=Vibrio salinus TaxID=2899784 RepID=UPI001E46A69A|nr:primosomal replication protein [Vibrio salinus]MCE0492833.1 primosomal replication protein [Vibrio salinus]
MKINKLEELKQLIHSMEDSAKAIDDQFGEHNSARFDKTLFSCNSKLLFPCVQELKNTYHELREALNSLKHNNNQTIEYLSERLLNQISAIQRELATLGLRRKEPKVSFKGYTVDDLYQQLAQHQDWERRLKMMIQDKSSELTLSSQSQKQPIQQQILNLELRLSRCQQSKNQLEKKIALRERKG